MSKRNDLLLGKMPPQSLDIEKEIIGAMIMDPDKIYAIFEYIPLPDYFYLESNRIIYNCLKSMYDRGVGIDLPGLTFELRKEGKLEFVGGSYAIGQIVMDYTGGSNVVRNCRILSEMYFSREIISIGGDAVTAAFDETTDVFDVLDKAEAGFFNIRQAIEGHKDTSINELVKFYLDDVQKQENAVKGEIKFYFDELDSVVSELQGGNVCVVAARTSMGKTAFLVSSILKQSEKVPVGIWQGELTKRRFMRRVISNISGIPVDELIRNPNKYYDQILDSSSEVLNKNLHIDNTPGITIEKLCGRIKYWVRKKGVRIVWLDYLQIINVSDKVLSLRRTKTEQVAYIIDQLNNVSKECDIPIILLCQVNRDAMKSTDKKPGLHHLRDSGSIEERVSHVLFLHRPEVYGEQEVEGRSMLGVVQVLVRKNSDGMNNMDIDLLHQLQYNRITSCLPEREKYLEITSTTSFEDLQF